MIDKYFTRSFSNINDLANYLDTTPNNTHLAEVIKDKHVVVDTQGVFSDAIRMSEWQEIWLAFAAYALIIAIAFAIMFKHKHDPKAVAEMKH
jgi:NHS family xanthosine MFS transporter